MASELHVDAIKHSGGTSALTIDSSGNVHGAGMCVQTVNFTHSTVVDTNSTSFVDSGLSGSITPKFSNSKIFVNIYQHFRLSGDHDHGLSFQIIRTVGGSDTTVYTPATNYEYYLYDSTANTTEDVRLDRFPIFVVDTPSTTSACTYKVQYRSMRTDNNNLASMQHGSNFSMGFLMEIAQ